MTGFIKTVLIHTFCISRNTILKYWSNCGDRFFTTPVISIYGWVGGRRRGSGGVGGQAEGGPTLLIGHRKWLHAHSRWYRCTQSTGHIGQDRHWQQFDTTPILISAPRWLHRPCNASWQFYRDGKKPFVKADLAIYSQELDASGKCIGVLLILSIELDFSSCVNWDSFCESSHI